MSDVSEHPAPSDASGTRPEDSVCPPLRPRDFAVLLLASGGVTPRQRARDQQADCAGLALKRRVLNALVALDPDPPDLERALLQIVDQLEPPSGPTRAIALVLAEEWRAANATPEWLAHLVGEAVQGDKVPKVTR
jgi:hypothetical protein